MTARRTQNIFSDLLTKAAAMVHDGSARVLDKQMAKQGGTVPEPMPAYMAGSTTETMPRYMPGAATGNMSGYRSSPMDDPTRAMDGDSTEFFMMEPMLDDTGAQLTQFLDEATYSDDYRQPESDAIWHNLWFKVVAIAVGVLLVVGGVVLVWVLSSRTSSLPLNQANPVVAQSLSDSSDALTQANQDATTILDEALGNTTNDWNRSAIVLANASPPVVALQAAIAAAQPLQDQASVMLDPTRTLLGTKPQPNTMPAVVVLSDVNTLLNSILAQTTQLQQATAAVTTAWMGLVATDVADSVSQSRTTLSTEIDTANQSYTSSEGQVQDEQTRMDLMAAINTATDLVNTPNTTGDEATTPEGVAAMWALKDSMDQSTTDLTTAQQIVDANVAAWQQAQQDLLDQQQQVDEYGNPTDTSTDYSTWPYGDGTSTNG